MLLTVFAATVDLAHSNVCRVPDGLGRSRRCAICGAQGEAEATCREQAHAIEVADYEISQETLLKAAARGSAHTGGGPERSNNLACSLSRLRNWPISVLTHHGLRALSGAPPLPGKLKHDAIVEALLEIRFDAPAVLEVLYGRLADVPSWQGFVQRRLPTADIPAPIRSLDPQLRFAPSFELRERNGHRSIRIGPQSISYHRGAPYVGWNQFKPELFEVVDQLFAKAGDLTIRRLGLRYLNALTKVQHGVSGVSDLNMRLYVAAEQLVGDLNVNFVKDVSPETKCTVRVATTQFVQGRLPEGTTAYVDVDVYTNDSFHAKEGAPVRDWINFAHDEEKRAFFGLLPPEIIEALRED